MLKNHSYKKILLSESCCDYSESILSSCSVKFGLVPLHRDCNFWDLKISDEGYSRKWFHKCKIGFFFRLKRYKLLWFLKFINKNDNINKNHVNSAYTLRNPMIHTDFGYRI